MLTSRKLSQKVMVIFFTTVICLPAILFGGSSVNVLWADTTLYNFEASTQGWTPQTWIDSQACISVSRSTAQKQEGTYSLRMDMDLKRWDDANKSKGESYVDRGESGTINLQGIPLNVWVYCPTGADGDATKPNGMQILFKDSLWRNWYGPWQNIGTTIPLNTWTRLTVTLGTTTPAYVDTGFDNTKIRVIGIKMATGGSSTATYNGPIYVDHVYTSGADTIPPAPPTGISVSDPGTGGKLNLSWTNPTDLDFSHIHIYRSTTNGVLGSLVADNQTGTIYQDTSLTNNTLYYYTLRSIDTTGNESTNTDQYSGMPTAPSSTTLLYDFEDGTLQDWILDAAIGLTNTTARAYHGTHSLTFTVPTSGGQVGLGGQGYVETTSYTPNYPYQDMSIYTGFSVWMYLDPGMTITPSGLKALAVIYTNGGGFYRGDHTALTITSGLVGTWQKVSFNFAAEGNPIVQYTTRMGLRLEGSGGEAGSAPLYIDYVEGMGYSGDLTPPGSPTGITVTNPNTGGTLNLSWTNPTDTDFSHIHIYRSTTSGTLGPLVHDNITGTSKQDTGLTNGTVYYYTFRSVDTSGNESTNTDQHSGTPSLVDTTPPGPPTGIYVVDAEIGRQLNIYWTNPGDADFNHIHVYRSTTSGTLGSLVYDNILGTSLADTGLTNGTTYYYTLRSVDNSSNESTNTDQHSGVPSLVTITALFDFEDGTTQGWVNDTTIYFRDNLGAPYNTTSRANTGARSLAFNLNFNDKDPTWGTINDVAYIRPASPYNLSGRTGISVYIYVNHTGFQYNAPPCATVYVKTGSQWKWFESKDYQNIPWSYDCGNFRKVSIDFSSAKNDAGEVVPVDNLNDVKEIGIHISGAKTASGSSILFLDTVKIEGGGDTTPPSPPTSIVVTDTQIGGELYLTWVNPPDGDFEHVNVYRSTTTAVVGEWIRQCANGTNTYLDTGLVNGLTYFYTLRSVDTSVNESINTDQHSGIPTMTTLTTLYDFEDSTRQGWVNDISGDFINNLGMPFNTTNQAQEGTHSLTYPLNFEVKDSTFNCINDAGYVQQTPSRDLSQAKGLALYVYIPTLANISADTPALVSLYVKTSSAWNWFESNDPVKLALGVWNRVTLNFLLAKNSTGQINQPVSNLDSVQEIGIHISGASTSSGNSYLYIDTVSAVGAPTEVLLSVGISGSCDFGTLQIGEEAISSQSLTVTNSGNITETLSFSLVNPVGGWTAVQTNPGEETYVLNAMLNSTQPLGWSFVEGNHALAASPQQCTINKFAGDQTGVNVPASTTRSLWLQFRAPTLTSIATPQVIKFIVSAEAS